MEIFFIENNCGMRVGILDYGAHITTIEMPTRQGNLHNVVLTYPNVEHYKKDSFYLGATIGRYANRIRNGALCIGGDTYQLSLNEKTSDNHLHGGFYGFNTKMWNVEAHSFSKISLSYLSIDGEEGYPGNLRVSVTYSLGEDNALLITYKAETDKATILNISNHSYFNLGDHCDSINKHTLQVFSTEYTPLDDRQLPIGIIKEGSDTHYDLTEGQLVSALMENNLFNTNYCFNNNRKDLSKMATLTYGEDQRTLLVESTYPGLQVYLGNYLTTPFKPMNGLCLEPQFYPDSPNNCNFPSPLLKPGETYQQSIKYSFINF